MSAASGMARAPGPGRLALALLAVALPFSLDIEPRVKALVPATLFLAGLWLLLRDRHLRACWWSRWPQLLSVALLIVAAAVNVGWHGLGWRPLDQPGHMLLYAVIAAVFALPLPAAVLWSGLSLSAALLGMVCIWQTHVTGLARAYGLNGGSSAAIELAVLLLALALLALGRALQPRTGRGERWLHLVGAALAIYGAALTQSRGPLLALLPALALLGWGHLRRSGGRSRRRLWWVLGAGLTGLVLAHGPLTQRFQAIGTELHAYHAGHDTHGSIGERLEMWRLAWRAFSEHPWQGIGLHRFQDYIHHAIESGRTWPTLAHYNQPHNEYLRAAAAGGVGMLAALLFALLAPLRFFLRHCRDADAETAGIAIAGAAVVVLYLGSALSAAVFYRVMPLSLYFFLTLGLGVHLAARTAGAQQPPRNH